MPTFDDPISDASEASAALRGLAHATRSFDDPADTYALIGDLLAGVRSLRQVFDQLAAAHLSHQARAHDDDGVHAAGARDAQMAADDLHQAAALVDGAEERLNRASQASGRVAWHPEPEPDHTIPEPRWVSVVFLQGSEADPVLEMIDRDGTDTAIDHLAGRDDGEETTQAALENGYVYDTPPSGRWDRAVTRGDYTLTYDYLHGHVGLLRAHVPEPEYAEPERSGGAHAGAFGVGQGFSQRRASRPVDQAGAPRPGRSVSPVRHPASRPEVRGLGL